MDRRPTRKAARFRYDVALYTSLVEQLANPRDSVYPALTKFRLERLLADLLDHGGNAREPH